MIIALRFEIMKLTILTLSLAIGINCEKGGEIARLAAADKEYLVKLEWQQAFEIFCLNQLDALVSSKWAAEEKKIDTRDLEQIKTGYSPAPDDGPPSRHLYHSTLEQWLMDGGSPSERVETCLRQLADNTDKYRTKNDICLEWLCEKHLLEEREIEEEFSGSLKNMSSEDLPFREFYSMRDFITMTVNKRRLDGLANKEVRLFEEMSQYLASEEDMDRQVFILQPECDWKRAAALGEAPDPEALLNEFLSQVRELVNLLLGSGLAASEYGGHLNLKLILEKHEGWLGSREAMEERLTEEMEKLRAEPRDAEWLCNYARDLAFELIQVQTSILAVKQSTEFSTKIWDIARRTRSYKSFLEEVNDTRYTSMNELATKVERDARCFEGFSRMVKNHHRKAIISSFMDSRHPRSIQELSCGPRWTFRRIIDVRICHCVGSFCVKRAELPGIRSTDYEMVKGNDTGYKIIPSPELLETVKMEQDILWGDKPRPMKR